MRAREKCDPPPRFLHPPPLKSVYRSAYSRLSKRPRFQSALRLGPVLKLSGVRPRAVPFSGSPFKEGSSLRGQTVRDVRSESTGGRGKDARTQEVTERVL